MTLEDFGHALIKHKPKLLNQPLRGEALARYVLSLYPEYYNAISSTSQLVHEIAHAPIEVGRGFWDSERDFQENVGTAIRNRDSYISMLHHADMVIEATNRRVPVETLAETVRETHRTNEQIRLEIARTDESIRRDKATRDIGLDGADRQSRPDYRGASLQYQLFELIEKRDAETHSEKRMILNLRITQLKEQLDELGRVVQDRQREGFSSDNESPDRGANRSENVEGNME